MIKSFKCKETKKIFEGNISRKLPQDIQARAEIKLLQLHVANTIEELQLPPSNRLHPLLKERQGQHAIWINAQYRICFDFNNGEPIDVEIVDYH